MSKPGSDYLKMEIPMMETCELNTSVKNEKRKRKSNKSSPSEEKNKRMKTLGYADELEEERLENLVFGQGSALLDALPNKIEELASEESEEDLPLKKLPAWEDDDDGETSNNRAQKFETIVGNPKWAELDRKRRNSSSDDEEEEDQEILRHCGNLVSTDNNTTLSNGTIEVKKNKHLNFDTFSEGPNIKAVEFHQTSTVALVAGVSGIASLFQVDGSTNAKLQSIQFSRFPIHCARISISGSEFIVGSQNHDHFYCYDMEVGKSTRIRLSHQRSSEITQFKNFELSPDGRLMAVVGRFGQTFLLTARTKELIGTLKMNSEVTAIAFNTSGSRLYSHGDSGEVYVWDTNNRSCVKRFFDDGCNIGQSLAVSSQYLATGSNSGAVNIYSMKNTSSPLKTLLNLRTPATCMRFNATEEILAIASDCAKNAVRLVHLPSFTVFSNFPGITENLWRPQCVSFSPNCGYLAIGNNRSTALLFRLKHYGNY